MKKIKFKKLISLFLVLMLMVIVVGCGSNEVVEEPNESDDPAEEGTNDPAEESAADKFPEGDIFATYSSKAGSGGDIFLRNLGEAVTPALNGHAWVVENRVGSSGAIAFMYVKEAEPDGYNLLGFTTSMISAGIINEMPVSYTDFEPVCAVANDPQYIYVKADSPWNTLQELIDDAIENPGEQKWGRGIPSGSNTLGQLLLLRSVPEAEITPVVFDGGSEVITAILGGHIDVGNGEYSELRGLIESGEIRLLAALTGERTSTLPDIPTAKELGYNAVLDRPRGLLAPKGTPDEIVQKIADIVETALENEEFVETLESEGTVVDFQRPEEFAETLDNIYNSYIDIDLYNLAHQE